MLNGERLSLHESTKGRFQGISCAYLNSSDKLITVCEGFADKERSHIPWLGRKRTKYVEDQLPYRRNSGCND